MSRPLSSILGYVAQSGIVREVANGINTDAIPPSFFNVTRRIQGDTCNYTKVKGTRKTARKVHRGDPSVRRELTGISEQPITLFHSFEHIFHDVTVLDALLNVDRAGLQDFGVQEVDRRSTEFATLFANNRKAMIMSALLSGYIKWDGNGNLLDPIDLQSSKAVYTVDYGLSETKSTVTSVITSAAIIDASWATDSTDIVGDIRKIKQDSLIRTGYPLRHAFYGDSVLGYIMGNTVIKALYGSNNAMQNAFAQGEIPNGFMGLQWHPVGDCFFERATYTEKGENTAGTEVSFGTYPAASSLGAEQVVFCPEPSPEWWEVVEGTYRVPTSFQPAADGLAARGNFAQVTGMFSYATITDDPPGIKHLAGDTFLPVIKVPDAVYIVDVVV